jgi:hypothetical protein
MSVMTGARNDTVGDFAGVHMGPMAAVIRCRRSVLLAMAVLPLAALVVVVTPGVSTATNSVTITHDSDGVPHIRAANFRALGYGEAWAFSQDNFCTLAQDFVTVEGQRSKYFGPNNLSVNYSAGVESSNLDSDLFRISVGGGSLDWSVLRQDLEKGRWVPLPFQSQDLLCCSSASERSHELVAVCPEGRTYVPLSKLALFAVVGDYERR